VSVHGFGNRWKLLIMEELGSMWKVRLPSSEGSDISYLTGIGVSEKRRSAILFLIRNYSCPRDDSNI